MPSNTQMIDLEHVEQAAVAKQVNGFMSSMGCSLPHAVVVPDGYTMVTLEKYMPEPTRMRGQYRFSDIDEWSSFIIDQGASPEKTVIFVDGDDMKAQAVFNHGDAQTPGHRDHLATLQLEKTPEFAAMLSIDGNQVKQKPLAEWVEEWAYCIDGTGTDGDPMDAKQLASSIRRITIESNRQQSSDVGDFNESRSALEQIDAKSRERMPAVVRFTCSPFSDLKERVFEFRLSILTSGDEPKLVLRSIRMPVHWREMAQELKEAVHSVLDDTGLPVYVGLPS